MCCIFFDRKVTTVTTEEWYSTCQRVPTEADEALARNGAIRLTDRVALNVTEANVFDALDEWTETKLWPALCTREDGDSKKTAELKLHTDTQRRVGALKQDLQLGQITATRLVTTKQGAPRKRHVTIALPYGITYDAGDYLAVLPLNSARMTQRVLRRFKLPWDAMLTIDPRGHHFTSQGSTTECARYSRCHGRVIAANHFQGLIGRQGDYHR